MGKRIYFQTEETKITKKKGWFEIDTDYTQIYNCFNQIAGNINSAVTFKLLFWLLANKTNEKNGIDSSVASFNEFNQHLATVCTDCTITYRTFTRSIAELKKAGALTQISRGHYYANPYIFWKDDLTNREEFITEERKYTGLDSINPAVIREPDIKLLEKKSTPLQE